MNKKSVKYLITLIVFFLLIIFSFTPSIEFLLNFANDDSFFYLKTAYNFSAGHGSTFDLINETNGYHPLWFLILSAYYFVINLFTTFNPELYFRLTVLLINSINASIIYYLYKYFKTTDPENADRGFILMLPLFLTFVAIRDYGMETHLTCLIIVLYIYIKSYELKFQKTLITQKIFLLCVLFLSRIDFLFTVIPVIIVSDYLLSPQDQKKKFIFGTAAALFFISIAYFFSNYIFFGNFLTITTKVKSSFPVNIFLKNFNDLFAPGTFTNQFVKSFYVLNVIILFLILLSVKKQRNKFQKADMFLFAICLSSLIFIVFNLFYNWYTLKEWYVAFPAFVCSILLVRMLKLFPPAFYISLSGFILIFILYFYATRLTNPKWDSMYYYALDLKKNTEPEDRIFMIDLSGIIGYFSERKVINGDGLINSFEYWKYRDSDSLHKYFEKESIGFYSTYSTAKGNHEVKDSSGYLIDKCYSNKFGGYSFTFPKENLLLKSPYYYFHAVNSDKGFWYLFKLN
ncbi:MAG: hypothetical protein IPN57_06655 [Ignavibacteria bacterium]|nr:hypothetical protein [Ignavibacteria bacterium]MBK9404196.1 hypothetical protein [Ignavibacteria bacterium]